MQKRGRTAAGTQRWFCVVCGKSSIKKRPDHWERKRERLFKQWLTGNATLSDFAVQYQASIQTIHTWLKDFW
jgi:transposase-like protein